MGALEPASPPHSAAPPRGREAASDAPLDSAVVCAAEAGAERTAEAGVAEAGATEVGTMGSGPGPADKTCEHEQTRRIEMRGGT